MKRGKRLTYALIAAASLAIAVGMASAAPAPDGAVSADDGARDAH